MVFSRRFEPGPPAPNLPFTGTAFQRKTMCLSGVDRLGSCDKLEKKCSSYKVKWQRPFEFKGTKNPNKLRQDWYK